MELKQLIRRFAYRIEPKPEGGFVARSTDPSAPPIEAPTREELQQKIQESMVNALGEAFPGLKQKLLEKQAQNKQVKLSVHIERRPEGGFAVHSDESANPGMDPATHEKLDHFAERMLNLVANNVPQVAQSLEAVAESGGPEIFTAGDADGMQKAGAAFGVTRALTPAQFMRPDQFTLDRGMTAGKTDANYTVINNTPITPESASLKVFLRLLLVAMALAVLAYFYFQRG